MTKKAIMSNCKDPENRSKKDCVCGGHQGKRGKKPRKYPRLPRKKVTLEMIKEAYLKDLEGYRDDDGNITFVARVQCPQCRSTEAVGNSKEDRHGRIVSQHMHCQKCGFQWSQVTDVEKEKWNSLPSSE